MAQKGLKVQMLGGFSIYYGEEAVALGKIGNSKSLRLLQMLLLSYPGGISKSELVDHLYGWNDKTTAANRNKNLNNLLYRLKGQLASCGLPKDDYVELREGMCYFKTEIPLELDTLAFEQMVQRAEQARGGVKRIPLFHMADEKYIGELLPSNLSETWFFQKSKYYKELYLRVVEELEQVYLEQKDYQSRLSLYTKAATIYPFENWQVKLIRCYLEIYQYEEAMKVYQDTTELYAREMGIAPTAQMQECFETLEVLDKVHTKDANDIKSWREMDKAFQGRKVDIRRALFEETDAKGAYYCTYPSFVDYCHLVVRIKERSDFSAVLMFLTLSQKKKKETPKSLDLPQQMQILKSAIGDSLRIGDAYTRYGNRHYILMLIKTEMEYCSMIFQRIESTYIKYSGKGELWYYTDMTQELNRGVL